MSRAADFPTQHGAQFSVGHLGPFAELLNYRFSVPALNGREVPGKVFVKDALQLTGVEMSYNCFPPGFSMPFLHAHRDNEEVYLFLSGQENSWWMARRLPSAKVRWCASPRRLARLPQHGRGADVFYCLAGEVRQRAGQRHCRWCAHGQAGMAGGLSCAQASPGLASASVAQQRIQPDIGDARNLEMQAWHQRCLNGAWLPVHAPAQP